MSGLNFLSVLTVFLGVTMWLHLRGKGRKIQDNVTLNSTYDYIIVGAGSAGSVIASRLSEDSSVTVLLIEAGPSDEDYEDIHIPLKSLALQRSELDWNYVTTPQNSSSKALKDNVNFWPRGRVLGGSSSLNTLAYVRGSRHDYDQWAADGCEGLAYEDVLPYFIKSEDNRVPWLQDSPYHGKGGPLKVSPGQVTDLNPYYSRAMQELGFDIVDCNGESQIGYEPLTLTTKDGLRCNTARCFLGMASDRPNLHISVNSLVTKVLIKNKSAFGVELIRGGRKHRVIADREIILSGGSINTPQLLMLSGIGPKKHLDSFKIPVLADLHVGQNLQDHIFILLYFYPNVSMTITPEKVDTVWNHLLYKTTGKGYFSTSALEGNAFFNTRDRSKNAHADVQLMFFSAHFPDFQIKKLFILQTEETVLKLAKQNRNSFVVAATLLHPKSQGTITLQSTDPFDPPIIDPQYLTEKADVDILLKGMKKGLELGNTKSFKELGINIEDTYRHFAQCTEHDRSSDAYFECAIRHYALTVYHPTTTCRMGRKEDPTSVVGSDLRVHGISNLRVADASVMRNVVSGNTNAPTIMIGEKAADIIRGVNSVKNIKLKLRNLK
ncbi:hypothetical protein FSP39_012290 [Pinctada imbricata]|uniref:Glucose-methanol-choline oxidoreductase N-terminal domain-containing protein n=1 Tax=Pinctada imbricata TaxID=66713 RepID=A0AA88YA61_PINIB|nr:hypothetical protein FSP39_012290 [Pinctada imbricata]